LLITRFIPAIGWFLLSLILLCLPGSSVPSVPWLAAIHVDKLIHITLFCILCGLFARPFHKSNQPAKQRKKWFFLIMLGGIVYGTAMEFVQKYWVPGRSFEIWDIVSDSTGCIAAFFYSRRWVTDRLIS
jgi:VanZ family protein